MFRSLFATCLIAIFAFAGPDPRPAPDLSDVKSEPKPEKRADKALDFAQREFKTAQQAYQKGDIEQTNTALGGMADAVQLAYDSLRQTGKDPSRSPKHFKKAEIRTREFIRHLDDFSTQMSAEDRAQLQKTRDLIDRVHQDILLGIMGSKESKLRTDH